MTEIKPMCKLFLPYTSSWNASEAIFDMVISDSGQSMYSIDGLPISLYKPTPMPNDVISELMCSNFEEYIDLSSKTFKIDIDRIIRRVITLMNNNLMDVLSRHMQVKDPSKTKLYQWLNNLYIDNIPQEVMRGIMLLYVYNMTNTLNNIKHSNNIIVILEVMREKYGKA